VIHLNLEAFPSHHPGALTAEQDVLDVLQLLVLPKAGDLQLEVLPGDPMTRARFLLSRSNDGPLISGLRRGSATEADLHDGAAQELVRFMPCPRES
jgi:hypothetical protein